MHYGDARFAKNFKARGAAREYFMTQFGGTGIDEIYDVKTITNGDFIVVGRTRSTTFCGIDISAYTNGTYYAYFIIRVDRNLPPLNWLKGSYFLKSDASQMGLTIGKYVSIEIDASDNIFYTWGTAAAGNQTDWKIYGIRSSDMTLLYTSDTAITVKCAGLLNVCQCIHKYYNGFWYVCYYDGSNFRVQRLNGSLAAQANTSCSALSEVADVFIGANGIFLWTMTGKVLIKLPWTGNDPNPAALSSSDKSARFDVNGFETVAGDGTYVYLNGTKAGTVIRRIDQCNQSNLAVNATYEFDPGVGKYMRVRGIEVDADGRLWATAYTNTAGTIGTADAYIFEINPSGMTAITSAFIKYPSGTGIGESGKIYTPFKAPLKLGYNKYLLWGWTDGDLTGFTQFGGEDAWIVKMDATGKILS